jgi:hypothetical protein
MTPTEQLRRGRYGGAGSQTRERPSPPRAAVDREGARPAQKHIFWASYFGWMLDGFDTTIYAFVLVPALKVILPAPG